MSANTNPVRVVNVPALVTVIMAVIMLLMVTVFVMSKHERPYTPEHPYSKYQTAEALDRQYTKCARNAQEGFTCLMVPMMVSEKFALEEGMKE